MGKKKDSSKKGIDIEGAIPKESKVKNKKSATQEAIVTPVKPIVVAPVPVATKKPAPKAAKKIAPKKAAAYTSDDVALRAYFISEKRRHHGIHGSEHQDWIEAERQLKAEQKKKTAPPRVR